LPAAVAAVSGGVGVGYLIGGDLGGLWGAGAGLLLGVLAMVVLVKALRGRR
jgi:hypothetical protein